MFRVKWIFLEANPESCSISWKFMLNLRLCFWRSKCFIRTSPSVATPLRDAAIARSISITCKASKIFVLGFCQNPKIRAWRSEVGDDLDFVRNLWQEVFIETLCKIFSLRTTRILMVETTIWKKKTTHTCKSNHDAEWFLVHSDQSKLISKCEMVFGAPQDECRNLWTLERLCHSQVSVS